MIVDRELVFVKLGGSIITDKTRPQLARHIVIQRLAREIAAARRSRPDLGLVLGHGSGSFGHVTAQRFGTRQGAATKDEWLGFSQVADVAAQLNRLVVGAFLDEGVPVWAIQPSATARCYGGELVDLGLDSVCRALDHGLVPVVYGDVALDDLQGATIISTEQILAYLARRLHPSRLLLLGVVDGVYEGDPLVDPEAECIPEITPANWEAVRSVLGGSHGTDVTGGMLSKIDEMIHLVQGIPELVVRLFSGRREEVLATTLQDLDADIGGTVIRWSETDR